jgi:hypothetical protein
VRMRQLVRREPPPHAGPSRRGGEAHPVRPSPTSRALGSVQRECRTAGQWAAGRDAQSSERPAPSPSHPSRPSAASRPCRRGPVPTQSSGPGLTR